MDILEFGDNLFYLIGLQMTDKVPPSVVERPPIWTVLLSHRPQASQIRCSTAARRACKFIEPLPPYELPDSLSRESVSVPAKRFRNVFLQFKDNSSTSRICLIPSI